MAWESRVLERDCGWLGALGRELRGQQGRRGQDWGSVVKEERARVEGWGREWYLDPEGARWGQGSGVVGGRRVRG